MAALQVLGPLLLLALILLPCHFLAADGLGSEGDYSYDPCSPLGPQNWGNLNPEWAECASGVSQSPISIKPSNIRESPLGPLRSSYRPEQATLLNKGHEVMVNWTVSPGYILIDGKQFHLRQCHWHSPSEHELYGKRYPLELHIVHSTSDSQIAVIGVLYEFNFSSDLFLSQLEFGWKELKGKNAVGLGSIMPPFVHAEEPYFRYSGSLTTPPCSGPVIWTVMKRVIGVTEKQLGLLRAPVGDKDNARPVQPINQRTVYSSHPHPGPENEEEGIASY